MNFGAKLKYLRNQREWSQEQMANFLGTSKQVISRYEKSQTTPKIDVAAKYASKLGVSADALIDNTKSEVDLFIKNQSKTKYRVPVLGRVTAGIPIDAVEYIVDYEEISEDMACKGEYFGLQIKGASMEPKFSEGDVVIVRKQSTIQSGEIGIILINGDEATIKKVMFFEGGMNLVPSNQAYEVMTFTNEQIEKLPVQILGKVVELRAKF